MILTRHSYLTYCPLSLVSSLKLWFESNLEGREGLAVRKVLNGLRPMSFLASFLSQDF